MHVNGLCHMDISPENVLAFPEEPRFVIHDFGLAIDSPIIKTDLLNPRGRYELVKHSQIHFLSLLVGLCLQSREA